MKRLVLTLAISLAFAFGGVAQSLHYDFEDGTLQGWTTLDGDGDGHCWESSIGGMGYNSNGMVMAYSKDYATGEPLTPNEYLVSPRLVLNEWPVINFFVCALDEIYCAEHFGVSISTTVNDDPLAFTLLHDWTLTAKDAGNRQGNWYEFTVDLSAYTGQEVYVAIRHFNCTDMFAICVDDIQIDGTIQQDGLVISPDILTFEEPFVSQTFTIYNQTDNAVTISSINVEPDDNVVLLSGPGLPRTLQPNETMNVEVYVNGIGYKGYLTYYVNVATSIGYRQVTVRVNEEAWDEGLLWMPMQGLTFDENSPLTQGFNLTNTNALDSITIYELYEDGTDYLELVPSHSLPYVIPPHESLYIDVTLVDFPENTTNVNIYSSSSLGQGSSPYVHIVGGLTPSSGELVITPDTLWVTDVYVYQKYFTITNETDHEVTISSIYTEDTIVSLSHYDPAYGLVNVEEVLPVTLEVGDAFEIKTGIQNIILPLAKRNDYIVSPIHIVSTEGENEVILMIDEAAISFGLIAYLPFYGLDSYEPHQFSLVNAEWSGPITITGIEEIGTDYLEITIEDSLPVTLENYGDYLRGSLKCREPFPFHAFVSTSIIVHTSIGDFGAIGVDIDGTMLFSPIGNEWYYEIENENGSITYQYLYQAGDTIVQDEPTHILVKINTLYDKDLHQDVTHEYVYERDGKVYWWNKTLEEFTVLYDFGAHEGDTWVTKVGTETLTMHVDAEEIVEYEGRFYRMLHVSDTDDIFSGDIVCGIGHLTSFFPERLMDNGDGIRVEGMRCYWVENELVFKPGDEDCDAVISELHGVEEESD
ncbi:MAG: hemagglutinin protein HagA [bacterium P201]|nr:MAG: hemagglutinin protein HagA [bacterium P201]